VTDIWLPDRVHRAFRLWEDSRSGLDPLCGDIATAFGLPQQAVADTARRRLVMDVAEHRLGHLKPALWWRVASLLWITAICLRSLLLPRKWERVCVDLLLDQWDMPVYDQFYGPVVEPLSSLSVALLSREEIPLGAPASIPSTHRPYRTLYPRRVAARLLPVLWRWFLRGAFSRAPVNPFYMAVIVLRKIGTYYADVEGVSARLMLSCADNSFEGVRYAVYRQTAIGRIDLMQNAMRGSLSHDMYLYADTYFAQGTVIRQLMPGLQTEHLVPIGSFRAAEARRALAGTSENRFDIAFIEQLFVSDMEGNNSRAAYDTVVDYLARFARSHPEVRICIAVRPGSVAGDRMARRVDEKKRLEGTGVVWSNNLDFRNSYEVVSASKLVVSYCSTLAFEAAIFGRRFLLCLPDTLYHLSSMRGPAILAKPTYEQFECRVLELLDESTAQGFDDYFEALGQEWMHPHDDPGRAVWQTVAEELNLG
jgi:hypothetical protein